MKHILFIIVLSILNLEYSFGQNDTNSAYKKLRTIKYYAVNTYYQKTRKKRFLGYNKLYKVNDKLVGRRTYKKYVRKNKKIDNCCPCILKAFDESDTLLWVAVSCTDCIVGWYKLYYRNGKIKVAGQYKENPTKNWKDIYDRGYCNVKHGKWEYFNELGDTIYSEFWNNGLFLKQTPEQLTNEIWKIELILKDSIVNHNMLLTIDEISKIKIIPKYKNKSTLKPNLTIEFGVSAIGARSILAKFTPENFNEINIKKMISDAKIPEGNKATYEMAIYENEILIKRFYLNIQ